MSLLIIKKGKVLCEEDDWDRIEEYKSPPNEVCLWRFERTTAGKLTVNYKDGALAIFITPDYKTLYTYVQSLAEAGTWPRIRIIGTPLPLIGIPVCDMPTDPAPEEAPGEPDDDAEEEAVEPEPAPVVAVRHRRRHHQPVKEEKHEQPVAEPRRSRRRTENTERVRRVRPG